MNCYGLVIYQFNQLSNSIANYFEKSHFLRINLYILIFQNIKGKYFNVSLPLYDS